MSIRSQNIFILVSLVLAGLIYYFSLPEKLFTHRHYSTILLDKNGVLLDAHISKDEQWQFPASSQVSQKYFTALIQFEDKRFCMHNGFDPLSFLRAIFQNIRAGKIVSGGSTLSMQTIRLHRNNPPRTIVEKIREILLAQRLEYRLNKSEILALYAAQAPFGGNVIGTEAACWRYYGKSSEHLSWAEAALLAVLPNSPGLIHTEKNRDRLKKKRNRLLLLLEQKGYITPLEYENAILEEIPHRPQRLAQKAPHLLDYLRKQYPKKAIFQTTIQSTLQENCNQIAKSSGVILHQNHIDNIGILVLDIEENEVLAYVGNRPGAGYSQQEFVDMIQAQRSTGSLLKPFLYAASLQEGLILEKSLLPDVPLNISGFQTENYSKDFSGLVPANEALQRSLNIPFAQLLQEYHIEKFRLLLQDLGLSSINKSSSYYGIPLILGGAESTLWELTNAYAFLGKTLNTYRENNGKYAISDRVFARATTHEKENKNQPLQFHTDILGAEHIWKTIKTLQFLKRPAEQGKWQDFHSPKRIAWKTGTSNGFKDAWAVGVNGKYAIGVWVGNADGEGRPGIIGSQAAAPIFFRVLNQLPVNRWFESTLDDLQQMEICLETGKIANSSCPIDTQWVSSQTAQLPYCQWHEWKYIDPATGYEVRNECFDLGQAQKESVFTIPSQYAYFYKKKNLYKSPPPLDPNCLQHEVSKELKILYPEHRLKIYLPKVGEGKKNPMIMRAFHTAKEKKLYWHINEEYIGMTQDIHEWKKYLDAGLYRLTIVDEDGNRDEVEFQVLRSS